MNRFTLSRRRFLKASAGTGLVTGLGLAGALGTAAFASEPQLTEDGLYHQPWFLDSFLEIGDDIATAADKGKHLAIMWELKGCPYCKETHMVNFARPDIRDYIVSHFDVLQLNIIGSRMVTDIDGEELSEKELAAKYGIRFTPSFQFFPKETDALADEKPRAREVARLPGYMKPDHFLAMFKYVGEEAYKTESVKDYLKRAMG